MNVSFTEQSYVISETDRTPLTVFVVFMMNFGAVVQRDVSVAITLGNTVTEVSSQLQLASTDPGLIVGVVP